MPCGCAKPIGGNESITGGCDMTCGGCEMCMGGKNGGKSLLGGVFNSIGGALGGRCGDMFGGGDFTKHMNMILLVILVMLVIFYLHVKSSCNRPQVYRNNNY